MRRASMPLAVLALLAAGPAAAGLAGASDVLELFSGLPTAFVIESEEVHSEEAGEETRIFRLRSAEPTGRGASGALYLRATVTIARADGDAAPAEVERRLAAADPDTGLSYGWDYLAAGDGSVVHLHADCTFSEESFREVARALAGALAADGAAPPAAFWCRCGGGCRAGSPFSGAAAAEPVRLPPVRRPEGVEEADYDNRLDPSGAWTSAIGELSLVHHANRLAFSYLAVFGPAAHICEGAGVAGLVGRDRYEWRDEQGTVTFTLTETEVRMRPTAGVASFCGAGWPGDRFSTDGFEPPAHCRVAVEHTHFHVVDTLDREPTFATAGQGVTVEVVPARHISDELWVLGRRGGPLTTRLGLLPRSDLACPGGAD